MPVLIENIRDVSRTLDKLGAPKAAAEMLETAAELQALRTQLGGFKGQLAAERERGERLQGLLDDARRANDSLRERVRSLEVFKASVDEALNSGDGSYRP